MDKNSNGRVKVSVTLYFFSFEDRNDQVSESKTNRKAHALSLQQQSSHSIFFNGPDLRMKNH